MIKLLLLLTLCVTACMANSTDVSKEEIGSVKQQLSSKGTVGPTAREAVRTKLESKVPEWAWDNVLKTPKPSRKGPTFERPREIARLFSNDDFEYIKTRKNGRDVYKDKSKSKVVKVNRALGYWKMIGNGPMDEEDESTFSLEDAVAKTHSFFDQLELPREQIRDVVQTDVMVSSDPEGETRAIARHVRIHRKVNGYKVARSRFMVTYGLQGTAFRQEVRWPKFVLKAKAKRKDRKKMIDELSEEIAKKIDKGATVKKIGSSLSYHFNENERAFEPVVSVEVYSEDQYAPPEVIEYSLMNGIIGQEVDNDSDMEGDF